MFNIISNPFAGNGKAVNATKKVAKMLKSKKLPFLVYFTEKKGDIQDYVTKLYDEGEREFILIGGDGTLHQFINSLEILDEINLGIIPAGTCNNLATTLSLPKSTKKALDVIIEARKEKIDYFTCNKIKCLNCFSTGISSEILKNMKCSKLKINYFFWATRLMNRFPGVRLNVKAHKFNYNGKRFSEFAVCNGKSYGNNIIINPLANINDGKLNIVATDIVGEKNNISKVISLFNKSKHIYQEHVLQSWVDKAEITNEENKIEATIDGEFYEFEKASISPVTNGLTVYLPTVNSEETSEK